MTPLLGFAPDADPTTPGVITDCSQLIPSERGMKSAPSVVGVSGLGALAAECRGAAVLQKTSGTRVTYAGTQTRIFQLSGGTWGTASGTFAGSSENRWMFAQFGDTSMATNDTEAIQYSTSGTFGTVATAPKARILFTVPNFVIAMNTADTAGSATYGDSPDRWWCSAFQSATDWTPAVTTQCTTGRLIGGGGELTAGAQFGTGWVAYKEREMFLAVYAGPPTVFDVQRIPGDQGCVGPEAVVDIGGAHIFRGADNFWLFDGSRPIPIANGAVQRWFIDNVSAAYQYRTIASYDRNNGLVWFFYPSSSSGTGQPDAAIVYHLATKRWGRANRTIEAAMNYVNGGVTWDTLNTIATTWDTLPNQPWDSQAWQTSGRSLAVFDTSHNLKTLTGGGENSSLTTGDIGDDDAVSFVQQTRLRFYTAPTSATVAGTINTNPGETAVVAGSGTMMTGGKFPIRQTGRWHRFAYQFVGNQEVAAHGVMAAAGGGR